MKQEERKSFKKQAAQVRMVLTPAGPGAGAAQGGFRARAEWGEHAGSRPALRSVFRCLCYSGKSGSREARPLWGTFKDFREGLQAE